MRVSQLEVFEEENKKLRIENQYLRAENAELKERLNRHSGNSNKPPSSDGYGKKPAFPKNSKGRQGGQTGHKGSTLHQIDSPDKVVQCKPVICKCGHVFSEDSIVYTEKRQVFDLPPPRLEVTEYRMHKAMCPVCGLTSQATAPDGVNAPAQYGHRVKAYAVLMNVHFKLPFKKI